MITSTGNGLDVPSSSGIRCGGNHKSHCAASAGAQSHPVDRIDRIDRAVLGTHPFTLLRNQRIELVQPIRTASTVVGMSGVSDGVCKRSGPVAAGGACWWKETHRYGRPEVAFIPGRKPDLTSCPAGARYGA